MTTLTYRRKQERRFIIFYAIVACFIVGSFLYQIILSINNNRLQPVTNNGSIDTYQAQISQNPEYTDGYAQLGLAYLQQVRETGDVSLYAQAEDSLNQALVLEPTHIDALMGQGVLALAQHRFTDAIMWAEQARAQNPFRAQILGIFVDAYIELGRYEEAAQTAQEMVDLRPDLASYSRVSYVRELYGDVDGAILAMETAVSSSLPGTEEAAWAQAQLGNLYLYSGQFDTAELIFQQTLYEQPNYEFAIAGLAEVNASRGDYKEAIGLLRPLVDRLPLPEFSMLLGDLYSLTGNTAEAQRQYDMVVLSQQKNIDAGINLELELALFEADHGDPKQALIMAQTAYEQGPTIHVIESLAWAHYQNGNLEEAYAYIQESMQLGIQDSHLYYRAGIIARALGDETAATQYFTKAMNISPAQHFIDDFMK